MAGSGYRNPEATPRARFFDGCQILRRESDFSCSDIFLQMWDPGRPRNRHNIRSPCQEPGQRELRGPDVFLRGNLLDLFHEIEVPLKIISLEAGENTSAVVRLQIIDALDLSAQKSASDRTVGNETNTEFAADRKNFIFGFPAPNDV